MLIVCVNFCCLSMEPDSPAQIAPLTGVLPTPGLPESMTIGESPKINSIIVWRSLPLVFIFFIFEGYNFHF